MPTRNALAAFWIVILLLAARSHAQCEPRWLPGAASGGPDGVVNAVTRWYDGARWLTVVGGRFEVADELLTPNVAAFDGTSWRTLGAGLPQGPVRCFLTMDDGSLLAGGAFVIDGRGCGVARWDGDSWQPVGQRFNGLIKCMALLPSGQLVVGGDFFNLAEHIAAWNGHKYISLAGGVDGPVESLAIGPGGILLAGGSFTQAGGRSASSVASWNGATWSSLGGGVTFGGSSSGFVKSIAVTPARDIIVAGGFDRAGNVPVTGMARWNGAAWSNFSPVNRTFTVVTAVAESVYASTGTDGNLFRWSGSSWQTIRGLDGPINALLPDGAFGVIAAGDFLFCDSVLATHLARFDGSGWSPLAASRYGLVYALRTLPNGDVVAGGSFQASPASGMKCIMIRRNGVWGAMGDGIPVNRDVYALTVGLRGDVYAGGNFQYVFHWDGNQWSALRPGRGFDGMVFALTTLPDGSLVAGGTFDKFGNAFARRIAREVNGSWEMIGGGFNNHVQALCVHRGELVALGDFTTALAFRGHTNVSVNHVARWDGLQWHALGNGVSGVQYAALSHSSGDLFVGGDGALASRWNGVAWSPLNAAGDTTGSYITSISELPSGDLLVTGDFSRIGGVAAVDVARFDGSAWHSVGTAAFPSGSAAGSAWASTVTPAGEAIVGCSRLLAHGRIMMFTADLALCPCDANCDGSTAAPILNAMDFQCFLSTFAAAGVLPLSEQLSSYANCDHSTGVPVLNVNDFTCFISKYAAGCP